MAKTAANLLSFSTTSVSDNKIKANEYARAEWETVQPFFIKELIFCQRYAVDY
jgi:hypothetical protein